MANCNREKRKKIFFNIRYKPLPIPKGKIYPVCLFLMIFLSAVLCGPVHAYGKGRIAVLPFKIISAEPEGDLNTDLQRMFSGYMAEFDYDVVDVEQINSILGDSVSFSEPEKNIIPLGKANNADWIVLGEFKYETESIQLSVKVLDTDTARAPFSVMMIENDRKNLPQAIKKIAESLSMQISSNVLIADIIIEGNERADDDAILNLIESRKGDRFDQEKLDRDLRTIYRMGFYDDVNFKTEDSPDGKIITFNLVEKPTIVKISFKGNDRKKDDKLREELGIKIYSVLNRNEIRQSVNRLLEFYRNDGYYDAEIKTQIGHLEDSNEVALTYEISEGEKVYIKNIVFKGNEVFDDDDLKDIMLTKEKGWLSWFTDSGVLDRKKLEFDLQRIRAYYDNEGYIRAQLSDPEVTYDEEEEGLTVTITISEGERYLVNNIKIEGDLLKPEEELRSYLDIEKGDPFSWQVINTEEQKIKDLYADMGYAYAETMHSLEDVEGENLVNVILRLQKNKRVRIERINIYGNEITKDKVLRRELKIAEGDYFSKEKLDKSSANLDRIELFENHEIKTRMGSSDDLMVIDIEGNEKLQRSVSFSAGYGGYEKFAVMLQYSNNNLNGRGQNFSIDALLGSRTTRFNATFTEPWLFDKPVRGSVTAYNWDRDYDEYTREQFGGSLGLAFLLGLDDFTRGLVRYTYDESRVTDIYSLSPIIRDMAGETLTSSATIGIERNSKDKWWDTTSGSMNYFTFEYAGGALGGDAAYNKYQLGSTFYLPVIWRTVLVVSTELGMVQGRSDGRLPLYEKFRLGGIDTVRGYEWGTISPLDPTTYDELGGNRKWLYKLEYRFPLVKGEGITGLVFFDSGNAYEKEKSWKTGAGTSVGFGIRWYSPMGPLRLEYGFKLNDRRNDRDKGRFEFKIGGSF